MDNQLADASANSASRAISGKPLPSVSETRLAALAQLNLELAAATSSALPTSPSQSLSTTAAQPGANGNSRAIPTIISPSPSRGDDGSHTAEPNTPTDHHVLIQALMDGAGLPFETLSSGLTPELMEIVGKLLATAVQGTIDLNATRALVKREAHADVTKVVVRNNNPLKFFADSQTVLIQMLRKKMPGFMGAVEAMQDAYEDLQAHQVGVVSGMRATMNDLLQRLNPEMLEKRLKNGGLLESLFPATRKAKLWDAYTARFQKIVTESSQDDFQVLFGKPFLQAYERKIEKRKKGTPHG